ncbi:hypothetical protein [Olleya sp. 1-3]|uniref:hypothetical protein n=1 Tax=Olleya sp. 1-3 TaxID=2058323 RepID=UPI0012FED93F|nr:hypothetical protein [Olleya sp. 1-3]
MLNRHSLLVTVMSMFELRFIKLCDWINTHFNLNPSLKRDKGSLLKQIRTYLINKAGLKFNTKKEEAWNELLALQSIRNNIIHNYGKYESKNVFIDKYIGSNKNISINVSNEFIFNHEFLKDLVPNFKTLCKELQEAMRDKSNNN